MPVQNLQQWSYQITVDPATENVQRRDIQDKEFLQGWLNLETVSVQQLNQLFFLLTSYCPKVVTHVYFIDAGKSVPDTVISADGRTFTQEEAPLLFEQYAGTMPDFTASTPTGLIAVMNKI